MISHFSFHQRGTESMNDHIDYSFNTYNLHTLFSFQNHSNNYNYVNNICRSFALNLPTTPVYLWSVTTYIQSSYNKKTSPRGLEASATSLWKPQTSMLKISNRIDKFLKLMNNNKFYFIKMRFRVGFKLN